MDRICCNVLEKICSQANMGRYTVISAEEFFEVFPEDAECSQTEIKKALKTLVSGGFIDVKYSDGEMFCAAPLKKYVPEPEPPAPDIAEIAEKPVKVRKVLPAFWGAFAGGALGSLIISLIFALI